jgi:hypothetical protein
VEQEENDEEEEEEEEEVEEDKVEVDKEEEAEEEEEEDEVPAATESKVTVPSQVAESCAGNSCSNEVLLLHCCTVDEFLLLPRDLACRSSPHSFGETSVAWELRTSMELWVWGLPWALSEPRTQLVNSSLVERDRRRRETSSARARSFCASIVFPTAGNSACSPAATCPGPSAAAKPLLVQAAGGFEGPLTVPSSIRPGYPGIWVLSASCAVTCLRFLPTPVPLFPVEGICLLPSRVVPCLSGHYSRTFLHSQALSPRACSPSVLSPRASPLALLLLVGNVLVAPSRVQKQDGNSSTSLCILFY